ncbi:MAG: TolC family protein [Candidatus Kryptonium sp.]
MKKIALALLIFLSPSFSQEVLTLEDAINLALKNNPDVKISKNTVEIALNNYSLGNAGFLPTIDLSFGFSKSSNNTRQEYFDGRAINRTGAASNSLNLGATLNWTIFDGFYNYTTYKKLAETQELVETTSIATSEEIIANVILAYYDILRQKEILKTLKESISISEQRVKIAEEKYKVGTASKTELLQAKVDLNSDMSALLRQEIELKNAKVNLNLLLGRNPNIDFDIVDTIKIENFSLEELLSKANENNRSILIARKNKNLARLNLSSIRSKLSPRINFFVGYNFTRSQSQAGFIALNQNLGLNYGISLSFNLFNGFNTVREHENARIELLSSEVKYEQVKSNVEAQVLKFYESYSTSLRLIELEKENLEIARENVEIAIERYRLGILTPLELREAQRAYISAESRLISALYQAKVAEMNLLKLTGQLGIISR